MSYFYKRQITNAVAIYLNILPLNTPRLKGGRTLIRLSLTDIRVSLIRGLVRIEKPVKTLGQSEEIIK